MTGAEIYFFITLVMMSILVVLLWLGMICGILYVFLSAFDLWEPFQKSVHDWLLGVFR